MKNIMIVKKSEVKPEYLETGEGNHMTLQDVFGKAENAPFTFGIAEIEPSVGIEFEYDEDGAVCFGLEGTINLIDKETSEKYIFEAGDVIFIPQAAGKTFIWNSDAYSKFAYATYPHWR